MSPRVKHYTCRLCFCYLITWMKNEKRYTMEELREHLRVDHYCTPQAVEQIIRSWSTTKPITRKEELMAGSSKSRGS